MQLRFTKVLGLLPPSRYALLIVAAAVLAGAGSGGGVAATGATSRAGANPIRKVVNMLKMMEKKIEQEGDKKSALFEKFMCYCKNTGESLDKSVANAEDRIPQLESSIKAAAAGHQQLTEDLKQHKKDREDAKAAIETADALRNKEAANFAKESLDSKTNLASLGKAIAAVAKGSGADGFLQTGAVSELKKLSATIDMASSDRELLTSFLSGGSGGQYSPQSGEILGILKQMQDDMAKDLVTIESDEESAVASHQSLTLAKEKEVKASSKAIEEKTGRVGELAVQLVSLRQDKDDAEEGMAEDKQFLADLGKSCEKKKVEWTDYQKNQATELMALADTVKLLNDDDALDLFKKTLPSPAAAGAASFLQVSPGPDSEKVRQHAGKVLRRARHGKRAHDARVDFVQMALRGKKQGFDAVLAKVNELIALLGKEQGTDDAKKDYCLTTLDKTDDERKLQTRHISDLEAVIANTEDSLKAVNAEIADLAAGIKDMDGQVAEATATRKEEHAAFSEQSSANNAAKDLLEVAKNRLAKFYNPALYKAPAKQEVSRMDEIATNFGANGEALMQGAPDANLDFKKKGEEHGGVVAMLNELKDDLERQIQQSDFEEKEGQKDYEAFEKDASEKRQLDSGTIAEKESARAELEAASHKEKENLKGAQRDLMETGKEIQSLHADCDWFLGNFDLRKEARASESDALNKAVAVLSGATFS